MRGGWRPPWLSTMGTNAAIVGLGGHDRAVHRRGAVPAGCICPLCCWRLSIGVWLFYVQHQFETTFLGRESNPGTDMDAALRGSSHYDLPGSVAVGSRPISALPVHHVHHLLQPDPLLSPKRGCCAIYPRARPRLADSRFLQKFFRCVPGLVLWDRRSATASFPSANMRPAAQYRP